MTCQMQGYAWSKSIARRAQTGKSSATVYVQTVPTDEAGRPLRLIILGTQQGALGMPNIAACDKNGFLAVNCALKLRNNCEDLKIKVISMAHVGTAGHRGVDDLWNILAKEFQWTRMIQDTFSRLPLLWYVEWGKLGPWTLASTFHGKHPIDVLDSNYPF